MSSKGDLDMVTGQIDMIDDRILKGLLERTKLVEKASSIKKSKGLKPYQPDRFAKILDRLDKRAGN